MKRVLLIATCAAALAVPAPVLADGCPGEDDTVSSGNIAAAELAMACLVNQFRAANGRGELLLQGQLAAAARAHSEDMDSRNYFSHNSPPPMSTSPFQRVVAQGYPGDAGVGENIATSAPSATPQSLMNQFIDSPPHRENMLGADYKAAGYGIAAGSTDPGFSTGGIATQVFGTDPVGGTQVPGPTGGAGCPKAVRLAAKLKRLRKNDASNSRIKKTKKALKKARKACG